MEYEQKAKMGNAIGQRKNARVNNNSDKTAQRYCYKTLCIKRRKTHIFCRAFTLPWTRYYRDSSFINNRTAIYYLAWQSFNILYKLLT